MVIATLYQLSFETKAGYTLNDVVCVSKGTLLIK
jgi:hypothetical protein